jgi:hypothetical protein
MAWNTMKMQLVPDRWNTRGSTTVPPELIGRIAPTRTEGINLRGVFSFPIEQCAEQLLPSLAATKSRAIVTTKIALDCHRRRLTNQWDRTLDGMGASTIVAVELAEYSGEPL